MPSGIYSLEPSFIVVSLYRALHPIIILLPSGLLSYICVTCCFSHTVTLTDTNLLIYLTLSCAGWVTLIYFTHPDVSLSHSSVSPTQPKLGIIGGQSSRLISLSAKHKLPVVTLSTMIMAIQDDSNSQNI